MTEFVENPMGSIKIATRTNKQMGVERLQDTRCTYKNQLYFCILATNNWKVI